MIRLTLQSAKRSEVEQKQLTVSRGWDRARTPSPDLLNAQDIIFEQARAIALRLSDATPFGGAGALHTLGALLDGAAGHLEALQTQPVNLAPANA